MQYVSVVPRPSVREPTASSADYSRYRCYAYPCILQSCTSTSVLCYECSCPLLLPCVLTRSSYTLPYYTLFQENACPTRSVLTARLLAKNAHPEQKLRLGQLSAQAQVWYTPRSSPRRVPCHCVHNPGRHAGIISDILQCIV